MGLSTPPTPSRGVSAPRMAGLALLFLIPAAWADESKSGWMEIRTAHVMLETDLPLAEARRAALLAERTRTAVLAAGWPGEKLLQSDRIELVVFADHADFVRDFGGLIGGVFTHIDYRPYVFLYGSPERWEHHFERRDAMEPLQRGLLRSPCRRDNADCRETLEREETTSVLKHELVHHLASFFYRRQPRWFSEGLAQYVETMRLSTDGKRFILGDINPQALKEYYSDRYLNVADALAWGRELEPRDAATIPGLYGLSWLMVHWLFTTHPQQLAVFEGLLAKGVDPDAAWTMAFPTLVPAELDGELYHFAQYGQYETTAIPVPDVDVTLHERSMSSADVHALRAVAAQLAGHDKEVRTELSASLTEDPGNVRALRMQLPLVNPRERAAVGRRGTAAHPEDGLAWLTLADALRENTETREESAQAYRKASELLPDQPAPFHALAFLALKNGRPEEALPLASTAARLAPENAAVLDTLATAFAVLGRCSEAIPTEARALDMLPEDSSPSQRANYAARLATIQKKCSEPPLKSVPSPSPEPPQR
jgi:tetratricopeptide (TPR) repeat protein